ncbi:hypothetical protein L6R29_03320 [Myxococcota bacterium]|nr:hypothetical protein [Myxococcota bacterium]
MGGQTSLNKARVGQRPTKSIPSRPFYSDAEPAICVDDHRLNNSYCRAAHQTVGALSSSVRCLALTGCCVGDTFATFFCRARRR